MTAVAKDLRVHLRWMIRRDLPEVLDIEDRSYDCPWREEDFLNVLRSRNCIGMTAECGERVVGYMIYELQKDHLTVINFAVHPGERRRGIGCQMAAKLEGKLSQRVRTSVRLVVRETNLPAQLFFRFCGFRAVGVARGYFDDPDEDGYRFRLDYSTGVF